MQMQNRYEGHFTAPANLGYPPKVLKKKQIKQNRACSPVFMLSFSASDKRVSPQSYFAERRPSAFHF